MTSERALAALIAEVREVVLTVPLQVLEDRLMEYDAALSDSTATWVMPAATLDYLRDGPVGGEDPLHGAAMRAAVRAEPWSFKEGSLRERLDWARWQHQVAAEARVPVAMRPVEENVRWHWACVRWYEQMVRDLMLPGAVE